MRGYETNCELVNCDKKADCIKNGPRGRPLDPSKPAYTAENVEFPDGEKVVESPILDFLRKPGSFEISLGHSGKTDPLEKAVYLKCSYCGRRFIKTQSVNAYKCHRCGKVLCPNHHLPENHKCSGKRSWNPFSR